MIALYKGVSLISWIIRIRTWSPYSHASWIDDDNLSEYEAWCSGGVLHNDKWGIRHTPGTEVDIFDFNSLLTKAEIKDSKAFFLSQVGKGYDWCGVFAFMSIMRLFGNKHNPDRWFCSEYISAGCNAIGRPLLNKEPYKIDPGDIPTSLEIHYKETWRVPRNVPKGKIDVSGLPIAFA